VSINTFKNKGAEGIVRYVGTLEDKPNGIYVGVELDEAKGDMDGFY